MADARRQLTPLLHHQTNSELWLIALDGGKQRLGGSVLAQVHADSAALPAFGGECPDLDTPETLRAFFALMNDARNAGLLLAYHDRSDGGAFAALCEMAFASHLGLDITCDNRTEHLFPHLFNEELGAIVQVADEHRTAFADLVEHHGLTAYTQRIAHPTTAPSIRVMHNDQCLAQWTWETLFDAWWSVTHAIQRLRDNPECADEEREIARTFTAPGLKPTLSFDPAADVAMPFISTGIRPKVAILREQGINGHIEMALCFERAGFHSVDIHMNDLITGRVHLDEFVGLAACGGFSYGDVLRRRPRLGHLNSGTYRVTRPVRRIFHTHRSFRTWGVQRLPDAKPTQINDPWCRTLATFRTQSQRAIRSPYRTARSHPIPFYFLERYGRLTAPRSGGPRRRLCHVRHPCRSSGCTRRASLYQWTWASSDTLSTQPQRLTQRHHRTDNH